MNDASPITQKPLAENAGRSEARLLRIVPGKLEESGLIQPADGKSQF